MHYILFLILKIIFFHTAEVGAGVGGGVGLGVGLGVGAGVGAGGTSLRIEGKELTEMVLLCPLANWRLVGLLICPKQKKKKK